MTESSSPYDWIPEVKPELKALDEIPLTGSAPPFPWKELATRLGESFERPDLEIHTQIPEWRSKEQLYEGMGDAPCPIVFTVTSLNGKACWVMAEQEMILLETLLLTKETHPLSFQNRSLSETFYRFFALEFFFQITQLSSDKTLTPILINNAVLPEEDSLCLDISIVISGQTLWGRLIVSPELRKSWVQHFAKLGASQLTQKLLKDVEVISHIEAGKTTLTLADWLKVQPGDFILLDQCSLDAEDLSGRVQITIDGRLAFRAKVKEGNIKILESPLYHQTSTNEEE